MFFPKNEKPKTVKKAAIVIPLIFTLKDFTKKKLKEKIKIAFRKAAPIPPTCIKSVTKTAGEVIILYIPINIFSCSLIT